VLREKHAPVPFFFPPDLNLTCVGLESIPALFGRKPAIDRVELIPIILDNCFFLLHRPTG